MKQLKLIRKSKNPYEGGTLAGVMEVPTYDFFWTLQSYQLITNAPLAPCMAGAPSHPTLLKNGASPNRKTTPIEK